MGEFYFFTDLDLLNSQKADQAFGPVNNNENTEFRVCSLHSSSGSPRAIASVNGSIRGRTYQHNGKDLINLVLKPWEQGNILGLDIKYIIYRGILKSSLINSSGEIEAASKNDLTKTIQDNQTAYNNASGNSNTATSEILGANLTVNDPNTEKITTLFEDVNISPSPVVKKGEHIGDFEPSSFGIEIVLEEYFSDDTIASIETLDHKITASTYPSSNNQAKLANKAQREKVLAYLDPAALIGMQYHTGVYALDSSDNKAFYNDASSNNVYEHILKGNSDPQFYNKHKLYVDIRNTNYRSLGFYENDFKRELEDVKLANQSLSSSSSPFFTTSFDWPLKIVENPSGANSKSGLQATTFVFNVMLKDYETSNPVIFFATGNWAEKKNGDWRYEKEVSNKKRFLKHNKGLLVALNYLSFQSGSGLAIPYNNNNSTIVGYHLKLMLITEVDFSHSNADNAVLPAKKYLDNLFIVPDKVTNVPSGNLRVEKLGHQKYMHFNTGDLPEDEIAGVFESGVAYEEDRVILFAMPVAIHYSGQGYVIPEVTVDNAWPFKSFLKLTAELFQNFEVTKHQLTLSNNTPKILRLAEEFHKDKWYLKRQNLFGVVLCNESTNNEFEQIKNTVQNNFDYEFHPVFLNVESLNEGVDNNQKDYFEWDSMLKGIIANSSPNGLAEHKENLNNLPHVFSHEGYVFSTNDGAQKEPGLSTSEINPYFEGSINIDDSGLQGNTHINNAWSLVKETPTFKNLVRELLAETNRLNLKVTLGSLKDSDGNIEAAGTTFFPGSKYAGYSVPYSEVFIVLEKDFLKDKETLSISKTIYHELIHARINLLILKILKVKEVDLEEGSISEAYGKEIGRLGKKEYKMDTYGTDKVLPGVYDYYTRFDSDTRERGPQHNLMATHSRGEIVNGLRDYDHLVNNPPPSRATNLEFIDVFSNSTVSYNFSNNDLVYQALSWAGLVVVGNTASDKAVRKWRKFAENNPIKSQAFYLLGFFYTYGFLTNVNNKEENSLPLNHPADTIQMIPNKDVFKEV